MNKDFINNNSSFSVLELKAYLFDLICDEAAKQLTLENQITHETDDKQKQTLQTTFNDNNLILNNIIQKANDLTVEIEKLNKEQNTKDNEEVNNSNIANTEEKTDNSVAETNLTETSENEKKAPTLEKENNESGKVIPEDENAVKNVLDEKEEADNSEVILSKETADEARAIIVSEGQFKKLRASKMRQQDLIINSQTIEKNLETNLEKDEKQKPIIEFTDDSTDVNLEDIEKDKAIVKDTEEDTKEESIEEMLERANKLYKEGNLIESQALYDKISSLNKAQQDKIYTKVA